MSGIGFVCLLGELCWPWGLSVCWWRDLCLGYFEQA